jgi:hypothetical protein
MTRQYLALTFKACLRYIKFRKIPKATGDTCIVAGNGPSLKACLTTHKAILQDYPLVCVNRFAASPEFADVKPTYYFMIDPNFSRESLTEDERDVRDKLFTSLNQMATWEMHLFFPCLPGQAILENHFPATNLHLHMCNIFPGFTIPWIRNYVYRTGLFMPPPQNVLVAALFEAINMGYKNIYLIGAEHSWTEDMHVGDDNVLYLKHKHFSGSTESIPFSKPTATRSETFKVHEIFAAFRRTFRSYWLLREYADSRGVTIYNATPDSYVDAFERRDLSTIGQTEVLP